MHPTGFLRICAVAAVLGGLLWALGDGLGTWGVDQDASFAATAAEPVFQLAMAMMLVAALCLALAVTGIHLHQPRRTGALGTVTWLLALVGLWWVGGIFFTSVFWAPAVAEAAPGFLDADSAYPRLDLMWMGGFMLFLGGMILFAGVQAWVANVNRWAALAVVIALAAALSELIVPFDSLLFGAAFAWLGVDLWRKSGTENLSTPSPMEGAVATALVGGR